MAANTYVESLVSSAKRLKISSPRTTITTQTTHWRHITNVVKPHAAKMAPAAGQSNTRAASQLSARASPDNVNISDIRLPKAVQAVFLAPLKRAPTHGIPVCDLQIRSYSVRNLEAFTDFCLRAAYYLNLPAKGPVPLPRITERWTVPRANFIFKKSQENFERKTVRRLIQIQDGHPETVAIWLAYLQKNRYYGVGLKANVFEHGTLDVAEDMEAEGKRIQDTLGAEWELFGAPAGEQKEMADEAYLDKLMNEPFKAQWGAYGGMGGLDQKTLNGYKFVTQRLVPQEELNAGTSGIPQSAAQSAAQQAKREALDSALATSPEDNASTSDTKTETMPEAIASSPDAKVDTAPDGKTDA